MNPNLGHLKPHTTNLSKYILAMWVFTLPVTPYGIMYLPFNCWQCPLNQERRLLAAAGFHGNEPLMDRAGHLVLDCIQHACVVQARYVCSIPTCKSQPSSSSTSRAGGMSCSDDSQLSYPVPPTATPLSSPAATTAASSYDPPNLQPEAVPGSLFPSASTSHPGPFIIATTTTAAAAAVEKLPSAALANTLQGTGETAPSASLVAVLSQLLHSLQRSSIPPAMTAALLQQLVSFVDGQLVSRLLLMLQCQGGGSGCSSSSTSDVRCVKFTSASDMQTGISEVCW
jgi:hypothetical protein